MARAKKVEDLSVIETMELLHEIQGLYERNEIYKMFRKLQIEQSLESAGIFDYTMQDVTDMANTKLNFLMDKCGVKRES
jgi:hypothetical protein